MPNLNTESKLNIVSIGGTKPDSWELFQKAKGPMHRILWTDYYRGIITGASSLEDYKRLPNNIKQEFEIRDLTNFNSSQEELALSWRDELFIEKYGKELYDSLPNPQDRDYYHGKLQVEEQFENVYKNHMGDFTTDHGSITTPEAKAYLLDNSYIPKSTLQLEFDTAKKNADLLFKGKMLPYTISRNIMTRAFSKEARGELDRSNKILEKAFEIDQEVIKRLYNIEKTKTEIKLQYLDLVDKGNASSITLELHEILNTKSENGLPYFPYYQAYKDQHHILDMSIYELINLLSEFHAYNSTASQIEDTSISSVLLHKAFANLTVSLQNKIHDANTAWDNTLKFFNNTSAKFVSSFGQIPVGITAFTYKLFDENKYKHFIMGLDENGNPLKGWFNPLFLAGMDQYGVWTVADYNEVLQNGGISDKQFTSEVGEEYLFWLAKTFWEMGTLIGYVGTSLATDYLLTGGIGAGLKAMGKTSLKKMLKAGVNPSKLIAMKNIIDNPVTDFAVDMARLNLHSVGESTLEASMVAKEVYDLALNLMYNPQILEALENEVQKRLQEEFPNGDVFIKVPNGDGNESLISQKSLREEEIRLEVWEYYKQKVNENALDAAGIAFATQATTMQIKNSIGDAVFASYLFAKPFSSKIRLFDAIDPKKTIINDVGEIAAKNFDWKEGAKAAVKITTGGALEEFTDNMGHNAAVSLGLNYNNNYMQNIFNSDSITQTALMLNSLSSWLSGASLAFTDEGAYYEAMIGALTPFGHTIINPINVGRTLTNKDYRLQFKNKDLIEKANEIFLYNPIARELKSKKQEFTENKEVVEAINNVIAQNGHHFKDIASSMSFVNLFQELRDSGTEVDARDGKFSLAFLFLDILNTLSKAGSQSTLYNKYLQILTDASKGNINQEMIALYLAQSENKLLILENQNKEQVYADAKLQIQKNANTLIKLFEEYQKTTKAINNFSNNLLDKDVVTQLTFLTMLSKHWESRIKEMEKSLTGGLPNINNTKIGLLNKAGLNSIIDEYQSLLSSLKSSSRQDIPLKGVLKELFLEYEKQIFKYLEMLNSENYGEVVTAKEILSLHPSERNRMLTNPLLYSLEQIIEIQKAENILAQRDPNYKNKINDISVLQERMEQNNRSYKFLLDNPQNLLVYKNFLLKKGLIDAVTKTQRMHLLKILLNLDNNYTFENGLFNEEVFVQLLKDLSSQSLQMIEDARPQYDDIVSKYKNKAILMETLNTIIDDLEITDLHKKSLKNTLANITNDVVQKEDVIDAIEDFIDSPGDSNDILTLKELLNDLLDLAGTKEIIRNAIKVENRGDNLQKLREARNKKDERNRKERERRRKKRLEKEAENKLKVEDKESNKNTENNNKEEKNEVKEVKNLKNEEHKDSLDDILFNSETGEAISPNMSTEGTVEAANTDEYTNSDLDLPATTEASLLRGNPFSPYVINNGLEEGILIPTVPEKSWLKTFFDWMRNAGIDYLAIIDFELAQIAALNPVVHYLLPNPNMTSTNDNVFVNNPLLVVEATEDIRKIHKEERGKYLRANNKDWLVIGTLGYSSDINEENAYNEFMKLLAVHRNDYFKHNSSERFFIDFLYTTKIKNIALGHLIRLLEGESAKDRSITELLQDPKRNPYGLQWKDLSFGLLTYSGFNLSRPLQGVVYTPKKIEENAGNIFLMVPTANGKHVPVAIKPSYINELKASEFKITLEDLLMQVTSPNYQERLQAIKLLCYLVHFTEEDNILIGTDTLNQISIKKNGVIIHKFDLLSENINKLLIFNNLLNAGFRVLITTNNLLDIDQMKDLDAAGALQTDIAILGTRGSHFTTYLSDLKTGKPVEYEPLTTNDNSVVRGNSMRSRVERSLLFEGKRVSKHNGIWKDEHDNPITDLLILRKIDYLNVIEDNNIPVSYKDSFGNNVYIVGTSQDNPIAIKVNKHHKVEILEGDKALSAINVVEQQKKREAAKNSKYSDISIWLGGESSTLETSNLELKQPPINKKETNTQEKTNKTETFYEVKREKTLEDLQMSKNLLTFESVLTDSKVGDKVLDELEVIFKEKGWGEMPDSFAEIASALESHNIPVPTSLDKIDSWLDLIKNCR